MPKVVEQPIANGKKRAAKVIMMQGMSSFKITVRNDEQLNTTRMVKPPSVVPKDKWVVNKLFKEQASNIAHLTRTQKRRL